GGVVRVDGPAYWPSPWPGLRGGRVGGLRRAGAGRAAGWVPEWYAPGTHPALIDWTVRQVLDSGVYVDGQLPAFASYDPRPLLPGLRVPVHYIHGELDTQIPLDVARTCAALTPGAEVSMIAGAGHLPHQERPAEFTAALRAALALMPPAPAVG
ncbi:alpha/beta fold hydrolase, partial [Streptomyces syringium]|uniref:alpha/beta fold hydrolase n=1 Tax=Streptomyces syringium TaxID=76729 RepID=UPI003684AF65